MIQRLPKHRHMSPALGGRDIHRCHQRNTKWRVGAWDPIKDVPGGAIRQLDVEDYDLDLTVPQTANGVGYTR